MSYLVVPGSFSPKCPLYVKNDFPTNVHSISYCKCNFMCEFCFFKYYKNTNKYINYSAEQFELLVNQLLSKGKMFKFTGGEPTLNKNLIRDLYIVKKAGGECFLDTNGSSPQIIKQLLELKLISLFGISLKGLSASEATKRSGIDNQGICWDNVIKSMSLISENSSCNLIVTYVCYDNFNLEKLIGFSKILENFNNVYLKINNFQPNLDHPTPGLLPKDPTDLRQIIKLFLKDYPSWKNRITLVDGPKAVSDIKEVIWM
ncbi:MAG: radical SAM protein [Clostridia bacterium]|nr:radical SAM protein [Clostridia bacterium]